MRGWDTYTSDSSISYKVELMSHNSVKLQVFVLDFEGFSYRLIRTLRQCVLILNCKNVKLSCANNQIALMTDSINSRTTT